MPLIEVNWRPNTKQLRSFGRIALIALAVISLLLYLLKRLEIEWALAILGIGIIIFLLSIISLKATKVIYLVLTLATLPIGLASGYVLLAAFYFLVLTPLAIVFRAIGRDALRLKSDPAAKSCWLRYLPPDRLERYFHQF